MPVSSTGEVVVLDVVVVVEVVLVVVVHPEQSQRYSDSSVSKVTDASVDTSSVQVVSKQVEGHS